MAAAADYQSGHGDHFADLMHHEALPVDFQRKPFRVVDDHGVGGYDEGFDDAFCRGITGTFVDSVVVEIVRAVEARKGGANSLKAVRIDVVRFFCGDVGGFELADGDLER